MSVFNFNLKLIHTKTRYNYIDWPKNDKLTKNGSDGQKDSFPRFAFSSEDIYRFFVVICPRVITFAFLCLVLQRAMDVTNTSFFLFHLFSKYFAGTFLNDHHVAQNVLNIIIIITIQNSQFWSSFYNSQVFCSHWVECFLALADIYLWGSSWW